MISVIMPSYNTAAYIRQATESVYEQTFTGKIELLIVDNGSSDETLDLLEQIEKEWQESEKKDTRKVRILYNPIRGVAKSRNMGIRNAKGNYIAFLDSDDWWDLTKIEKQMEILQKDENCVICCTGRELMNPDGTSTGRIIPVKERITYRDLLSQNHINCSSVLVKTDVALKFPMKHDDSHEDYIMWLQILKEYEYAIAINEPFLKTRLSEGGKSRNKFKSAIMTWKVYRYMGYSVVVSCWYFIQYAISGVKKYYG